MKKICTVLIMLTLVACTAQQPVSQAPVYNITLTDNSQWIVGDNNATESHATTKTEQVAEPTADAKADSTTSNMWIYALIMTAVLALAGYLAYRKWWK